MAKARSKQIRKAAILQSHHLGGLERFEVHLMHFIAGHRAQSILRDALDAGVEKQVLLHLWRFIRPDIST